MGTSHDTTGREGQVIDAGGVGIYYETHGHGQPLVLLHSGSLTGAMWQPYLAGFAERYYVITPDLPAHGRSGNSRRPLSYRHLADDIAAFIDAIGVHKPLVVGFSDGGQVALEIGMRYPFLPQAIGVGGTWFKYSDVYRAFVRHALGEETSPDVDTALLERNHPDWVAWLDQIYGQGNWKPLLAQLKRMWTTPLNYTDVDFAGVTVPTLVFIGDRDALVPVEEATELYRRLSVAELAVVADADHSAFFSRMVTVFQSIIQDFLHRHSA